MPPRQSTVRLRQHFSILIYDATSRQSGAGLAGVDDVGL